MTGVAGPAHEPAPAHEQRWLSAATRVGGVLVAVGLVTTLVIVGLYLTGSPTPGTWAYVVAMLAPLGFGLILVTVVVVALRRRRDGLDEAAGPGGPGGPPGPPGPAAG